MKNSNSPQLWSLFKEKLFGAWEEFEKEKKVYIKTKEQ